jgi:hypothetical protein
MIELDSLDTVDRATNKIAFYQRRIDGDRWLQFEHWP